MRCDDLNAVLADYIGGELDTATLIKAERHLAECGGCRARAAGLGLAQRAAASLEPSAVEAERATAALELPGAAQGSAPVVRHGAGERRRAVRHFRRWMGLAALIGLAFATGYTVRGRPTQDAMIAEEGVVATHTRLADTYADMARKFPRQSPMAWGLLSAARR
jgi:anti-sigma factor RsiW